MEIGDRDTSSRRPPGLLREPRSGRLGINLALWAACLLLVCTAVSLVAVVSVIRTGFSSGLRLTTLRIDTDRLLTELKDVETGQRGYLVNGDPVFLDPYNDALPRVVPLLNQLLSNGQDILPGVFPPQLRELVQHKLEISAARVALGRANRLDEARSEQAGWESKNTMDAIRVIFARATNTIDNARVGLRERTLSRTKIAAGTAMASALLASLLVGAAAILLWRQSVSRLRMVEAREALALDAGELATWEWDWRTNHVNASPSAIRLLGLPQDAPLQSGDLFATIHPDERASAEAALRAAEKQEMCAWEGQLDRPEGAGRWVHLTAGLYRDGGVPTVLRGVAQDVTSRREAEDRTRNLEIELWHASRVSTVGEVASATAHELSQPLSAAGLYLQSCHELLHSGQPYDVSDLLVGIEQASDSVERAGTIVRNMNRFLRKGGRTRTSVDINAAVVDAVRLGSVGFKRFGERVMLDLAPELPRVMTDQTQIQQVVVNLVRNALEAMAESAVRELRVRTTQEGDTIRISVADTGPGLPAEIERAPFQPFASTKPNGLGLGLSICRSIVEAHNGTISVTSSPQGTVFTVQLQAALEERADAA